MDVIGHKHEKKKKNVARWKNAYQGGTDDACDSGGFFSHPAQ